MTFVKFLKTPFLQNTSRRLLLYLYYDSCHAKHNKISVIYSHTLRLRRIYSKRKDLISHAEDLKGWFVRRAYHQRIVEDQVDRAFELSLKYDAQQNKKEYGISLPFTYNPAFKDLLWKN